MFGRYIGIDYSGEGYPTRSYCSLAVCLIDDGGNHEFPPPERWENWSRSGVADWIIRELTQEGQDEKVPTLVGIDHAFSFPIKYFRCHDLPLREWDGFLSDFKVNWPTDEHRVVDLRRRNPCNGHPQWRRLTDDRAKGAQSVLDFEPTPYQAQVATHTYAGLPWLRRIRGALRNADPGVRFWPFDGWDIPEGHSAIVEVYPALWNWRFSDHPAGSNDHRRDAYSVARWMWEQDRHGLLRQYFEFGMPREYRLRAQTEGWIFGLLW